MIASAFQRLRRRPLVIIEGVIFFAGLWLVAFASDGAGHAPLNVPHYPLLAAAGLTLVIGLIVGGALLWHARLSPAWGQSASKRGQ